MRGGLERLEGVGVVDRVGRGGSTRSATGASGRWLELRTRLTLEVLPIRSRLGRREGVVGVGGMLGCILDLLCVEMAEIEFLRYSDAAEFDVEGFRRGLFKWLSPLTPLTPLASPPRPGAAEE